LSQRGAANHGGVEPGTAEGDGEEFLEGQDGVSSSSRERRAEKTRLLLNFGIGRSTLE